MSDKIINVTRSAMPSFEEYTAEIRDLWDSRWLTNFGEKHRRLQSEMCEYLGTQSMTFFCNGHLALETAITAFGLTGEVITTPFTFSSTTQAIVRCGLTPVFCDINEEDYTIDVEKIESLITERTSAIIPVHVYGSMCDTDAIDRIAKAHGLRVIYDAAHAFGVRKDGRGAATFGDAAMFSFHSTKVFHTIEGGGVACSDPDIAERMKILSQFGAVGEDNPFVAANEKMTEFQAAMGLCNMRHIGEYIAERRRASRTYDTRLRDVPGIKIRSEQPGVQSNYSYYPVVIDPDIFGESRDSVRDRLAQDNIFARKYFYPLTSELSAYKGLFPIQPTPIAKRISQSVLCLPLYPELDDSDIQRICDIILKK